MMMQDPNPLRRGPGIGQIKEIQLNEEGKFDFNFDIVLGDNEIAELTAEVAERKEAIAAVEDAAKADTEERKAQHAELTATVAENKEEIESSLSTFQAEMDDKNKSQDADHADLVVTVGANKEEIESSLDAYKAEMADEQKAQDDAIATEKDRIDAILLAATADTDSFADVVALVNSIDTENDEAFAGYVLSNNEAVAELNDKVADNKADTDKAIEALSAEQDDKNKSQDADHAELADKVSANKEEIESSLTTFQAETAEGQKAQDETIKANADEAANALADAQADLESSIAELADTVEANAGAGVQNTDYRHSTGEFEAVEGEAYSFSVEGDVTTSTAILFVNGIQTNVDACNYDAEGGETVVSFTPVATDSGAVYALFGVNFS